MSIRRGKEIIGAFFRIKTLLRGREAYLSAWKMEKRMETLRQKNKKNNKGKAWKERATTPTEGRKGGINTLLGGAGLRRGEGGLNSLGEADARGESGPERRNRAVTQEASIRKGQNPDEEKKR